MKKILEVLQDGDGSLRFNTDVDLNKTPEAIFEITTNAGFSMATKLWGGNELSVLSIIRALAVADLSLCVNRKEILKMLDDNSRFLAMSFDEAKREFEKNGGRIITFAPGVMPSPAKS